MRQVKRWSVLIGFLLVVAACSPAADEAPTPTAAPTPAPAPTFEQAPNVAPVTTAPQETIQVAFFMAAAANAYLAAQLEGAIEAAPGLNAEVTPFDGEFNSAVQLAQMQDAITSGKFDAFLITPNDGNALRPAIEEAAAEGINSVCMLIPCGSNFASYEMQVEGQIGFITSGNYWDNGTLIGAQIVEACGDLDPCKVGYMPGLSFFPFEVARTSAVETYVSQFPAVSMVASVDGFYTAEAGLPAAQDLLVANPDIKVFATAGDQMAVGIEIALNDAGIEGVAIIGNGGTVFGTQAILEGRWFSSPIFFPVSEGRFGLEMAVRDARGETIEEAAINTHDFSPIGGIVTQDNAGDFTAEWDL